MYGRYVVGGKLEDIPKPWLRRWADPEKRVLGPRWDQKQPPTEERREVRVKFSSWVGTTAINATHYNVSIEEVHNPIWDEKDQMWRQAWDDIDGEGRELTEEFTLAIRAVDWAKIMIAEHFGDEEIYDVDWNSLELFAEDYQLTDVHHLYAREGD